VTLELFNRTFEPLAPQGRPAEAFAKGGKMTFEKEVIEYAHVDPAHTDGDAYVHFTGPNVLHTGDLLFKDTYPVIDYSTGGWIGGMAAACDVMAKVGNAQTRIIPGHGAMATRADLIATRDLLRTVQDRLMPMVKQGRSVDEVVKVAPTKDLDDKWGKGFMTPENFVRAAYTSLVKRQKT
jgi:cyclase